MGSCSNRGLTQSEKISQFAKKVSECRDISDWDFQIHTGAEIRGELGIERGNAFIKAIKDITR